MAASVAVELALALSWGAGACTSFDPTDEPAAAVEAGDVADVRTTIDDHVILPPAPDVEVIDAGRRPLCETVDPATLPTDEAGALCPKANLDGDPRNCGWCGHTCSECKKGLCTRDEVLVQAPTTMGLVSVDDASVVAFGGSVVYEVPRDSTTEAAAATRLAEIPGSYTYNGIYSAALGKQLYLHTYDKLFVAPGDGGVPIPIDATVGIGTETLAVAGGHLLLAANGDNALFDLDEADLARSVKENDLDGILDLTATPDGRFAFFIARKGAPDAALADGGRGMRAQLYRYTIATATLEKSLVVDAPADGYSVLAADRDYLFYTDSAGSILRRPIEAEANVASTVLLKGSGQEVHNLAVDDEYVYFFTRKSFDVNYFDLYSLHKCGGAVRHYVADVYVPLSMVASDRKIYFTPASGNVSAVSK